MSLARLGSKSAEELHEFIDKVDEAIAAGSCALYFDATFQVINLELFALDGTRFTEDEWDNVASDVDSLDQLMVFAFGDAPREFVVEWASGVVEEGAVERLADLVDYMRDNMPALAGEWQARRGQLAPSIGDISASVVFEPARGSLVSIVRADAFFSTGVKLSPVGSTRKHFEARMSKADLKRAIYVLQSAVARFERYEEVSEADD